MCSDRRPCFYFLQRPLLLILNKQTKALKGAGTEESPVLIVRQCWDFEGDLLAERDPLVNLSLA
jgi:hypothetical protein